MKKISIQIPSPCSESWDKMLPNENGRFCLNCSKTVIDFTKSSNEKLIALDKNKTSICGRFYPSQLNQELVIKKQSKVWYSFLATSLLLSTSKSLHSQTNISNNNKTTILSNSKLSDSTLSSKTKIIYGRLFYSNSKTPIVLAKVYINQNDSLVTTDEYGKFQLNIPELLQNDKINIHFQVDDFDTVITLDDSPSFPLSRDFFIPKIIDEFIVLGRISTTCENALMGVVLIRKKRKWWQRKS